MKSELRRCMKCRRYTLLPTCSACGSETHCPVPPKYSPEDRMGDYRRKTILERYGENGKHNHL